MATDQQIIDHLARGASGAAQEHDRRPGQSIFDTARYLSETEAHVLAVYRANREAVDSEFRLRNSGPAGVPFHLAAGHHTGDLVLAGTAPVDATHATGVWVPDADHIRTNDFAEMEIDTDDPNYDTILQLDATVTTNGAGTWPAGTQVPLTPGGFPYVIHAGDSLWFQFGGLGGTAIPASTVYIVFS
jgi:hypothetical protein